MTSSFTNSAADRLAARIDVVTERASLTDYVDRLRNSIEDRVSTLETAVGILDDKRKEINSLFASLRRTINDFDESSLATRMTTLEAEHRELKNVIEALRVDVREAVTYLGATTHTRLSTLGGNIENLQFRTSQVESNVVNIANRLTRYFNAWPLGSLRRLRRKIRRLPETPFS